MMKKLNGAARRRVALAFAVCSSVALAPSNVFAVDSELVADVKTKLTTLTTDSTGIGMIFLGLVAVFAVVAITKKFLSQRA